MESLSSTIARRVIFPNGSIRFNATRFPFSPTMDNELLSRGGHAPKINLPATEMTISHNPANTPGIQLRAETETGVRKLYWFVDKTSLGGCDEHEVLLETDARRLPAHRPRR